MENILNSELIKEKKVITQKLSGYDQLKKRLDAINVLLGGNDVNFKAENKEDNVSELSDAPYLNNGYDKNLVLEEKVLYVLHKIKEGYASQVAEKLGELDGDLKDRADTISSYQLSKLLKDGKVKKVGQSGRKYKYGSKY